MPRYEPWSAERATTIIAAHRHRDGAALPILHALQHAFGYVPDEAIRMVAEALNLSRAEVHGTVTFYHDFRKEPPGRRVLKLCRAEACQAAGGDALAARAEEKLGVKMGETTPDNRVTLEPVYCLGLCDSSPAAMLDRPRRRHARRGEARCSCERGAGMTARVFISRDAGALCVGADEVARALFKAAETRGLDVEIVRTGSRGMYWLEPTGRGRAARGPHRLRAGQAVGHRRPARRRHARRRQASPLPRPRRGHPVPQAADPAHLRPLRHHRSAVARRLQGAWRLQGPGAARSPLGPEAIVEEVVQVGPARPRRRGLPDRHQVAHRRRRRPAAAEIHRLQRRRGRQRHLRRPHDDGGRSLRADRGHGDRRHRRRRDQGLHLHPLRISARHRGDGDARSRRARGGLLGATSPARLRLRHRGAGRRRRLCLRRGDLAAREPRGQARRGPRQAAAAGPSRACSASRPSSTTCCRLPPCRSSWREGAQALRAISAWAGRAAPCRSSSPATSSMAACSRPPSASRSASWSTTSAAARSPGRPVRAVQVGGPLGAYFPRALFDTPFDYEAFAAARRADRPWRHRRVRRHRRHGEAGALRHGVLRHRKLRQVHALPDRLDPRRRGDRPDHRRRGRAPTTSRCSKTSATR